MKKKLLILVIIFLILIAGGFAIYFGYFKKQKYLDLFTCDRDVYSDVRYAYAFYGEKETDTMTDLITLGKCKKTGKYHCKNKNCNLITSYGEYAVINDLPSDDIENAKTYLYNYKTKKIVSVINYVVRSNPLFNQNDKFYGIKFDNTSLYNANTETVTVEKDYFGLNYKFIYPEETDVGLGEYLYYHDNRIDDVIINDRAVVGIFENFNVKYGLINVITGEIIIDFKDDNKIFNTKNNNYIVGDFEDFGLYDENGKTILSNDYKYINDDYENIVAVTKDSRVMIYTKDGTLLFDPRIKIDDMFYSYDIQLYPINEDGSYLNFVAFSNLYDIKSVNFNIDIKNGKILESGE